MYMYITIIKYLLYNNYTLYNYRGILLLTHSPNYSSLREQTHASTSLKEQTHASTSLREQTHTNSSMELKQLILGQ